MALREVAFYFIRHGETDWNRDHRAQGRSDIPLNPTGYRQAEAAAAIVADLPVATLVSSPLRRAYDTATVIAARSGHRITVLDGLAECCWGAAEGTVRGQWFVDWKAGRHLPPGAESYGAFLARATAAVNAALALPGPVLIVAHGGVYWSVQHHGRLDVAFDLPNARPVHHRPPRRQHPWWEATVLHGDPADAP